MKVKNNQLVQQVNDSKADLTIQQLKKEKDQLQQLVNKYHESKNASIKSSGPKTKKVGNNFAYVASL